MLQIGIVIKMTGLLLLTPSTANSDPPLHVLMPAAHEHLARIGYRQAEKGDCLDYDSDDGICYRDMEGFSMEIGASFTTQRASPVPLNGALGNLTRASRVPVDTAFFGNKAPPERLRARITLLSGSQIDECHLGRWLFNWNLWAPLANVVTWEIPDTSTRELALVRRRLGSDPSEPPETLTVLRREGDQPIELFITHLPVGGRIVSAEAAAQPVPSSGEPRPRFRLLMKADHFNAYYDMLGVDSAARRPLPRLLWKVGSMCPWARDPEDKRITSMVTAMAAGAPTCMVAGGTPAPSSP